MSTEFAPFSKYFFDYNGRAQPDSECDLICKAELVCNTQNTVYSKNLDCRNQLLISDGETLVNLRTSHRRASMRGRPTRAAALALTLLGMRLAVATPTASRQPPSASRSTQAPESPRV